MPPNFPPLSSLYGQRVLVYRDPIRGCLYVLKGRRLIARTQDITLANVDFRVSPSGRQRVLRKGQWESHAYAIGIVAPPAPPTFPLTDSERITYDPYRHRSFVLVSTEQPVYQAALCRIVGSEIWLVRQRPSQTL